MTVAERRLAWDACLNVRDLGGLRAGDQIVRPGVLVRASTIGTLTRSGAEAVRSYNVRTVIDIRRPDEVALLPSPFALGATYRRIPVDAGMKLYLQVHAEAGTLGELLETFALRESGVRDAVEAVAHSDPAIVVHCQAGRDRTGFLIALILAAVGVADQDIIDDSCASDAALVEEYERSRREHPDLTGLLDSRIAMRGWVMSELLRAIRERYGHCADYLQATGVSTGTLDRLRRLLLS